MGFSFDNFIKANSLENCQQTFYYAPGSKRFHASPYGCGTNSGQILRSTQTHASDPNSNKQEVTLTLGEYLRCQGLVKACECAKFSISEPRNAAGPKISKDNAKLLASLAEVAYFVNDLESLESAKNLSLGKLVALKDDITRFDDAFEIASLGIPDISFKALTSRIENLELKSDSSKVAMLLSARFLPCPLTAPPGTTFGPHIRLAWDAWAKAVFKDASGKRATGALKRVLESPDLPRLQNPAKVLELEAFFNSHLENEFKKVKEDKSNWILAAGFRVDLTAFAKSLAPFQVATNGNYWAAYLPAALASAFPSFDTFFFDSTPEEVSNNLSTLVSLWRTNFEAIPTAETSEGTAADQLHKAIRSTAALA